MAFPHFISSHQPDADQRPGATVIRAMLIHCKSPSPRLGEAGTGRRGSGNPDSQDSQALLGHVAPILLECSAPLCDTSDRTV